MQSDACTYFSGNVITVKMLSFLCTARCYWHRGEICTLTDPWLNKEVKMMPGILGCFFFKKKIYPCSPRNNANHSKVLAFQ